MTGTGIVKINNMPEEMSKSYVVARIVANEAWYYGNYNQDRAIEVSRELGENAFVVRVAK